MKTNDELNILVTGGIPLGLLNKNVGELTEDEEKQIRINVMTANEKLRLVKMTDIEIEKCYKAMKMMDGWN